jgi:hypothetical protein
LRPDGRTLLHQDRAGTLGFTATAQDGADMRALILVMDSVGVGAVPDAARYGGTADNASREAAPRS